MTTGTGTFAVVCSFDPAIDVTAPADHKAYSAYLRDRRDHRTLATHPGQSLTVYVCRPLTRAQIREVRNHSDADKLEACFVRGVTKVINLLHKDGARRDWQMPSDGSGLSKPIPDSALEEYFDEAEIAEVGMVVMSRSFLARRSGGHYPLPAISVDALRALQRHHAEQTSASAASGLSSPAAEATPAATAPEPSSSAPPGDASTDATATASPTSKAASRTKRGRSK